MMGQCRRGRRAHGLILLPFLSTWPLQKAGFGSPGVASILTSLSGLAGAGILLNTGLSLPCVTVCGPLVISMSSDNRKTGKAKKRVIGIPPRPDARQRVA